MHEVSIILSVLDTARDYCRNHGYSRIDAIRLRIGRASGVLPDALQFAFEISRGGTMASEANLLIDEVPVSAMCHACGCEFTVEEKFVFSCAECGSVDFSVTKGREMDIVELEVS